MNEFDRDCMEKKNIARSAHKRPGMYLGTNCSLPSDHLTAAELQQMSGPLVSYQLGKPMSWEDFKKLPPDLMRLYLQNLQNKYGGTVDRVAAMFGISRAIVFRYSKTCRVSWSRPKNDAESAKVWALFMGEPLPEEPDSAPAAEEPGGEHMIEEQKPVKDLQPVPAKPIVSNELQFAAGKLKISGDLEDILDALRRVLPKRLSVEIKFEQESGYDQR